MARGARGFIFGIGHGYLGDVDPTPSRIGDDWKGGDTLLYWADWSNFEAERLGSDNAFDFTGLGVFAEVGEWLNAPKTGEYLLVPVAPFFDSSGTSLWEYDEQLHKLGPNYKGGDTTDIPRADVTDPYLVHVPTAGVNYPMEGWQPYGDWDKDGGPSA